jgi:hypothetical protein
VPFPRLVGPFFAPFFRRGETAVDEALVPPELLAVVELGEQGPPEGRQPRAPPTAGGAASTSSGCRTAGAVHSRAPRSRVRQADERLGIWHALPVEPAERPVDQAAPHFALALVEAPLEEVLEDQHPTRPQPACPVAPAGY